MRVTQNMMANSAIHWISEQTEKLSDAQTTVGTGKQTNKPSDDPDAAGQILEDRTTISEYAQYISNISQANTWIEAGNTTLETVSTLLESAQDIIASESYWDSDNADSYLEQLESIYDQVVDLANTTLNSSYIYGGNNANTTPFADEVSISDGTASTVVLALAGAASDVTIEITNSAGEVVRSLTVSAGGSEGTNTITWDGCDDDDNLLADGTYDFTVSATDSSGNAVAAYPAYRGETGGKQFIIGESSTFVLNNDGEEIFSEALSSLSQAITALKNSTYSDDLASELCDSLGDAIEYITTEQVTLANITSQMTTADDRLDKLTLTIDKRLLTLEVGSTEEAAIKLEAQETAHEVTLEAVSSVLKMSKLSDYI